MRRPIEPTVPPNDSISRRIRDSIRDTLRWIDSGTRTEELKSATAVSSDLIEIVKSDGLRYKSTITDASLVGPAGPAGTNGTNGTNGADGAPGTPAGAWPILRAPSSPDAWDMDTSTWTDPDIAVNGWTIQTQTSSPTVLTRAGDVSYLTSPAVGTYRSTLIGGVLVLQVPGSNLVVIKKASSGNYIYKTRAWCSGVSGSPNNSYMFVSQGTNWATTGSFWYYTGVENQALIGELISNTSFSAVFNYAGVVDYRSVDLVKYIHDTGSGSRSLTTRIYTVHGNEPRVFPGASVTFTTDSVGVLIGGDASKFVFIDQIRRLPPTSVF